MSSRRGFSHTSFRARLSKLVSGPQILAFAPALCLGAFWIGGESALIAVSLGIPLLIILINPAALYFQTQAAQSQQNLIGRTEFTTLVENIRGNASEDGLHSAIFIFDLDEYELLIERHGQSAAEAVVSRIGDRFEGILRDRDVIAKLGDHRFAICLCPVRQLDLETCIQMAGRMQLSVEEPVSLDGTSVFMTTTIGFCMLSRAPGTTGRAWMDAAELALTEARKRGHSAIRSYSKEIQKSNATRVSLRVNALDALENGEVQPWYQPQISTDTGLVTGFEALARWNHPHRGIISPVEFLPAFEDAGLLDRLGEVMLYHSLTALKAWDASDILVPCVGVNFSGSELSNPRLSDKVKWELDRFDLTPDRLSVEILETVVSSSPSDSITRNIRALSEMGCHIDLDDFGTGNASIAAIKRFQVSRIKIDRSFVMKSDRDPDQQRMVGAILTMAERLNVDTLAEGVETVGEHALLSQLGCGHVQGFGIARPMPFDKTIEWIHSHEAKLADTPEVPKRNANKG